MGRGWEGPGGGREVLLIAYPLILGHMSFTIQTFVDRLFLTWYSAEAVAGAVTSLFTVWSLIALFTGTAEYLTTRTTRVLLRFVAVYSLFDMMNLIFAAGLKGAGDTVYPLGLTVGLSWGAMLVPGYVACVVLGGGVYVAWCAASAYVILLGLLMVRRFRAGRWKSLRVIEERAPGL